MTNQEKFQDFVNQCFEVGKDSFLYSLNSCLGEEGVCAGIQAYDPTNSSLPPNHKSLVSDEELWMEKIKEAGRIGGIDKLEFIANVPAGTKLSVKKIFNGEQGTLGKFWYIQFKLDLDDANNISIYAPTPYMFKGPSWTMRSRPEEDPLWDEKFVNHCG